MKDDWFKSSSNQISGPLFLKRNVYEKLGEYTL